MYRKVVVTDATSEKNIKLSQFDKAIGRKLAGLFWSPFLWTKTMTAILNSATLQQLCNRAVLKLQNNLSGQ